jgi:hypothetical protein
LSAHGALAGRSRKTLAEDKEFVMATIVTGEPYMRIDGKLHEIKRQIRQPNGYPHDLERLNHALQAVVDGNLEFSDAESIGYLKYSDSTIGHLLSVISRGWKITEHVGQTLERISDLEAIPFFREKNIGDAVDGEEMRRLSTALGATLGFHDAVFTLRHGAEIPDKVRSACGGEITFPGTLLVSPDGVASVASLRWINQWLFVWRKFKDVWFAHDYVARLKTA